MKLWLQLPACPPKKIKRIVYYHNILCQVWSLLVLYFLLEKIHIHSGFVSFWLSWSFSQCSLLIEVWTRWNLLCHYLLDFTIWEFNPVDVFFIFIFSKVLVWFREKVVPCYRAIKHGFMILLFQLGVLFCLSY